MNDLGSKPLVSARVLLRKFDASDADMMFKSWCQDKVVTKYLSWEPHQSISETKQVLNMWLKAYETPFTFRWAIVDKTTSEVIGTIDCVKFNQLHERAEIGYALSQAYWNKGIMSECLKTVMRYLFEEVRVNRIMARHYDVNPASGKVMEKCGMQKEGTFKAFHKSKDDGYLTMIQYAIIKKDYDKLKELENE